MKSALLNYEICQIVKFAKNEINADENGNEIEICGNYIAT